MDLLIKNIKGLVQVSNEEPMFRAGTAMAKINEISNAFLLISNGTIARYGKMEEMGNIHYDEILDAKDRFVLPTYIDSHTHLVFPGTREKEFELKIKGATYEEIAASGGGILNSAKKMHEISEEELLESSLQRLSQLIKMGTGAVEIKSGYGLSTEAELKMLRVIKKIRNLSPVRVKATFLGAHAVPAAFKNDKKAYLNLVINEMLPEIQNEKLADYIDIFIEKGFYSVEDAEALLEAAAKYKLKAKIHVDQLNSLGGVELGLKHGAISVDHLENITDESIKNLLGTDTVPVLLPSCSFYLNMKYPPARKMIDSGLGVAIASDFNPGSSPSGNLNFSMALACLKMKLLPSEALNAITVNAARSLELQHSHGSISPGFPANLFITEKISNWVNIPYSFGRTLIDMVILNGKIFHGISW